VSLRLAPLSPDVFGALAGGDVASAERLTGLSMTPWFAGRTEIWQYMLTLLRERPENIGWLMQAVVLGEDEVIGNAGFKGAPLRGQVELGYSIDPAHRRRGHAVAAVDVLLDRARSEPAVSRVVARIASANDASIAVVTRAGFVPDGDAHSPTSGHQLQFARLTPGPDR